MRPSDHALNAICQLRSVVRERLGEPLAPVRRIQKQGCRDLASRATCSSSSLPDARDTRGPTRRSGQRIKLPRIDDTRRLWYTGNATRPDLFIDRSPPESARQGRVVTAGLPNRELLRTSSRKGQCGLGPRPEKAARRRHPRALRLGDFHRGPFEPRDCDTLFATSAQDFGRVDFLVETTPVARPAGHRLLVRSLPRFRAHPALNYFAACA